MIFENPFEYIRVYINRTAAYFFFDLAGWSW